MTKRLLLGWRDGTLGFSSKLSARTIEQMSSILINIKLPCEIHRKLRGLDCLAFWKGSEFSTFLHYAGIIVVRQFLPEQHYEHFLLLFCSATLLSSEVYRHNWPVAEQMLEEFIKKWIEIYGEQYITSNVHNMQHITHEVERFGVLDSISAYPFENALQKMKHLLRHGSKSLSQVVKRLSEVQYNEYYTYEKSVEFPTIKSFRSNVRLAVRDGFSLNKSFKDCWFMTEDSQIGRFINVDQTINENFHVQGKIIGKKINFFNYPICSSVINVYEASINDLSSEIQLINISRIKCKLVAVELSSNDYVFIPLLHTLK